MRFSRFSPCASSSRSRPLPLVAAATIVVDVALLSDRSPQPTVLHPHYHCPISSQVLWPPGFLISTALQPVCAFPCGLPSSSSSGAVDPLSLPHFPAFSLSSAHLFLSRPPSSSYRRHRYHCGRRWPPLRPPSPTHCRPPLPYRALTIAAPSSSQVPSPLCFLISTADDSPAAGGCPPFQMMPPRDWPPQGWEVDGKELAFIQEAHRVQGRRWS